MRCKYSRIGAVGRSCVCAGGAWGGRHGGAPHQREYEREARGEDAEDARREQREHEHVVQREVEHL